MIERPVKFGILGAANIARAFASGVAASPLVSVEAVASRGMEKARAFATEFAIPTAYGTYEALLADSRIEAVYIPLPNDLHLRWAIAAMRAGKHVLCEKPLALSANEVSEMYGVARQCGVHLMEAYPYRAQPHTATVQALLRDNEIGRVRMVTADFGVTFKDVGNIRLNPERGGGALFDLGAYTVNFVRMVTGERPGKVYAKAQWTATGVDDSVVGILDHPGGILAHISCSLSTAYHRHALIAGATGSIETRFLNSPPEGGPAVVEVSRGVRNDARRESVETEALNGFRAEAESFAALLASGAQAWTGSTPQESFDTISTLEALLKSARTGEWVVPQAADRDLLS